MLSKEAAKAIVELSQWFAHEKLIEFTEEYEEGDRTRYREMVRMEEIINLLKSEERRLDTGRGI